jgi:tetratricopeptide (TPR) repeat protein
LPHLRLAREEFERLADELMAIETLDWESSALGLLEDAEALPLANEALERCRKMKPGAPLVEARILGHIAGMFVVAHAWVPAIRYYEAAAAAASGVKDLQLLAKMHHGLGVAYQRIQRPATARQHFDKALSLYSIETDLSAVYRVEIDLGDLLLQQGHLDSAEEHLLKALAGSNEWKLDRRGVGYILTNLGEVCLRRGELSKARDYLDKAVGTAETVRERIVLANAHVLLGELEERNGRPHLTDEHFDIAIRSLEELNMPDRLRDAHMDYAELLEARQDVAAAMGHWKRAAEIGKAAALGARWIDRAAAGEIEESLA